MTESTKNEPPLLSPLPFESFTPDAFMSYVRSLFVAPPAKKVREIRLKQPPKVHGKRTKTGKLSFTTSRKPAKWITETEMREFCVLLACPENEAYIALRKKGFVVVTSHEEGRELCLTLQEIPF